MPKRKSSENGEQPSGAKKFRRTCHRHLCEDPAEESSIFCLKHDDSSDHSSHKGCQAKNDLGVPCARFAQSDSEYCYRHTKQMTSFTPKCQIRDCQQNATDMRSWLCLQHQMSRYKKCSHADCTKTVYSKTEFCVLHSGKQRCQHTVGKKQCQRKTTPGGTYCSDHAVETKQHTDAVPQNCSTDLDIKEFNFKDCFGMDVSELHFELLPLDENAMRLDTISLL